MTEQTERRHWSESAIDYLIETMSAEIGTNRVFLCDPHMRAIGWLEDTLADRFAEVLKSNGFIDKEQVVRRLAESVGLQVYESSHEFRNKPILYNMTAANTVSVDDTRYVTLGEAADNRDLLYALCREIKPAVRFRSTYLPELRATRHECGVTVVVPPNFQKELNR